MAFIESTFLQTNTVTEQVYEKVQRRIIEHRIKPGSRIIVNKIAKELGVSSSPIRESLRWLEKDGLTQFTPHRGVVTVVPTLKKLEDIFKIRIRLEAEAVREASLYVNKTEISELTEILEGAKKAIEENDVVAWGKYDDLFHKFFVDKCGNVFLQELMKQIAILVRYFRNSSFGKPEPKKSLEDHELVYKYFLAGETEKAVSALSKHIEKAFIEGRKQLLFQKAEQQESYNLSENGHEGEVYEQ